MKFEIAEEVASKAKMPHEIFLTNLIGNHILWFVASLGLAKSYWQPLAMVPVVSLGLLVYTLWRARRSKEIDDWFVMCHWQICAARSRVFIYMLLLGLIASLLGWVGYAYFGMMEVAVYALVGGIGGLPVMVTVLVLILMESDALHQTILHKLPDRLVEKYPPPEDIVVVEEIVYDH
ncbi:MAG: hypothetical protein OI74_07580 [Gammaproteobacteria bacterium (ex Lamellibrachia satsuma)]|nr:MAG: hypothetical protein HPY30_14740 [Gammaproteobacteria bacterium (ex Lamellibrachia satsuma)]RRS33477.1 MAG: hypothetical protein OI74_07580 [Gammaproteobacteria bacterium (ex Lamellibrachia satsuma)]RRS34237.1 MAG: hypothetical protein NV67_14165 [Gammaproteobacteria bacterium (ex Lamellibrachia satsuma)]